MSQRMPARTLVSERSRQTRQTVRRVRRPISRRLRSVATLCVAGTLVFSATGCSGMRNFLFGRGARCGSGVLGGRGLGLPGCLGRLNGPAPHVCPPVHPMVGGPIIEGPIVGAPIASPPIASSLGCGCTNMSAAPAIDPYLAPSTGYPIGSVPIEGTPIYGDPVYNGGTIYNGVVGGDNFQTRGDIIGVPGPIGGGPSRRVDTDGAVITSESPLPPGANVLPGYAN